MFIPKIAIIVLRTNLNGNFVFVGNALAMFMFHLYLSDVLSKWFYLVGWLLA